ncbi:hypothetical protein DICVIV_04754 [Dictyocaulus viviparus]|uniref:CHK kinase-like domain-containing protein n=1 Tax=Dictyocaulus viviparus TaxID=29172 RepID=A0A0D8XZC4_DICVI|nr:hypothetical protein DICVIV_04754 [Dictyocaulus viviparus]
MLLSQLVAKELNMSTYTETQATVTLNGVTVFELKNSNVNYRVFLVRNNNNEAMELSDAAKLAAFFNSKFFHMNVTKNSMAIPCGRFEHSFRIDDDDVSYLVFVIRFQHGVRRRQLNEHELCQASHLHFVAEKMAIMHAINTATMPSELLRVIEENHENIRRYQKRVGTQLLEILREALKGELSRYFSIPTKIISKLETLMDSEDERAELSEHVICHGHLTAEKCFFNKTWNGSSANGYQYELVDISEWENVHFGDVASDLSNLIISSAEPYVRRKKYMTIFRSYYYSRVDRITTTFKLADLKELFQKHHKEAVLMGSVFVFKVLKNSRA